MANGPKRQSNANRIANRKVAWAKAQKRNEQNRKANDARAAANKLALSESLDGLRSAHVEERTHTKVVLNKKSKLPETVTYVTRHAERPSKALRRLKRAAEREAIRSDELRELQEASAE